MREVVTPQFTITHAKHDIGTALPRHAHEHATLSLTLSGRCSERIDSRTFDCHTMSVAFKPPGAEHSNEYYSPTLSVVVEVLPDLWNGLAEVTGTPPPFVRLGGLSYVWMLRMLKCLDSHGRDELSAEEFLVLLLAAEEPALERRSIERSACNEVADRIRGSLGKPPRLGELARLVGYHPTSLARAFRRHRGISIGQFIHRCRIDAAIELIANGTDSISCVASSGVHRLAA
jgi:hypothetical protein